MGSALNFRTFARNVSKTYPHCRVVVPDLPGHGESVPPPFPPVDSDGTYGVEDCAISVERLLDDVGVRNLTVVCGHSFGGKVAMRMRERSSSATTSYWVLDSSPGSSYTPSENDPNSVANVIRACRKMKEREPFESKGTLVDGLGDLKIATSISAWMTTNLRRHGDQYVWRFDLDIVQSMFDSYNVVDCWPSMASPSLTNRLHLVRARRNRMWDDPDIDQRVRDAVEASEGTFQAYDMDCGHWVHAERPTELFGLMRTAEWDALLSGV